MSRSWHPMALVGGQIAAVQLLVLSVNILERIELCTQSFYPFPALRRRLVALEARVSLLEAQLAGGKAAAAAQLRAETAASAPAGPQAQSGVGTGHVPTKETQ